MRNIFPFLTVIVILIFILYFIIRKSNKAQEDVTREFWEREKQAKLTRPVDLGTIAYLNVPLEKFSFGTLVDPQVQKTEQEITAISKKPLLNLTGKTNTELREIYGSPNLAAMQEIGEDFDNLTLLLVSYAGYLFDEKLYDETIPVLEYGVLIKSDVSKNYTLLGDCYFQKKQPRRIEILKDQVKTLGLLREKNILDYLEGLISQMTDNTQSEGTDDT